MQGLLPHRLSLHYAVLHVPGLASDRDPKDWRRSEAARDEVSGVTHCSAGGSKLAKQSLANILKRCFSDCFDHCCCNTELAQSLPSSHVAE
mmetsp:Transcript_29742/g.47738  ORF Transcript_29742/g.47738 Transcript_29742/m.47738 type:complete len:91 (+) Transcript_29742:329-601(+)